MNKTLSLLQKKFLNLRLKIGRVEEDLISSGMAFQILTIRGKKESLNVDVLGTRFSLKYKPVVPVDQREL